MCDKRTWKKDAGYKMDCFDNTVPWMRQRTVKNHPAVALSYPSWGPRVPQYRFLCVKVEAAKSRLKLVLTLCDEAFYGTHYKQMLNDYLGPLSDGVEKRLKPVLVRSGFTLCTKMPHRGGNFQCLPVLCLSTPELVLFFFLWLEAARCLKATSSIKDLTF